MFKLKNKLRNTAQWVRCTERKMKDGTRQTERIEQKDTKKIKNKEI